MPEKPVPMELHTPSLFKDESPWQRAEVFREAATQRNGIEYVWRNGILITVTVPGRTSPIGVRLASNCNTVSVIEITSHSYSCFGNYHLMALVVSTLPLHLCFPFHHPLDLKDPLYMLLWVIRPSSIELYQVLAYSGVIRGDMIALLEYVYN